MGASIEVKTTGDPEQLRRFEWTTVAAGWADMAIPMIRVAIDEATPVGKGPTAGRLREKNRVYRVSTPGKVSIRFANSAPEAEFVIKGTRAHDIFPLHAKALHFSGPDGDVFSRHVHHPGTKPNRFHERGYSKVSVAIKALLDRNLKERFT